MSALTSQKGGEAFQVDPALNVHISTSNSVIDLNIFIGLTFNVNGSAGIERNFREPTALKVSNSVPIAIFLFNPESELSVSVPRGQSRPDRVIKARVRQKLKR